MKRKTAERARFCSAPEPWTSRSSSLRFPSRRISVCAIGCIHCGAHCRRSSLRTNFSLTPQVSAAGPLDQMPFLLVRRRLQRLRRAIWPAGMTCSTTDVKTHVGWEEPSQSTTVMSGTSIGGPIYVSRENTFQYWSSRSWIGARTHCGRGERVPKGGHCWWSSWSLYCPSWPVGRCGRLHYRPTRSEPAKTLAIRVHSIDAFPTSPNSSLMPHFAQNSMLLGRFQALRAGL